MKPPTDNDLAIIRMRIRGCAPWELARAARCDTARARYLLVRAASRIGVNLVKMPQREVKNALRKALCAYVMREYVFQ